jgi:16S rRNA G966 N2-methylase RsmD
MPLCAALLEDVANSDILTAEGLVLVQHDRHQELPTSCPPLSRLHERVYGDSVLSVFARGGEHSHHDLMVDPPEATV